MRLLFVMDPPARINPRTDTTYVIMREAQGRGHEVLHCEAGDLGLELRRVIATARPARINATVEVGEPKSVALADCDAVLMRKDPPYDLEYYFATLVLEKARGTTLLVNDPAGLRDANEKLYALNFPEFVPPSITSRDPARLRRFMHEHGGEMIVKPLDGCGGRGVFYCSSKDRNVPSILETLGEFGKKWIMAQKYLPEAREGDKRILLLDGEPIGAVLRVPREDEVRGNLHVGGKAVKTTLDERERRMCQVVGERLRKDALWFVGLDVIGGQLTEVNVTSPTGVQEINALEGVKLEAQIVDWIERAARER